MNTSPRPTTEIVDPRNTPRGGPADYELLAATFLTSYRNQSTRDGYRASLKRFFAWCESRQMDPLYDVRRPHIEFWMRHMEEVEGLKPRTIVGCLNAVSGYYRYAIIDGFLTASPVAFVKRPYIQRKTTTNYLTGPELARVVKLAEQRSVRDHAIFCLLGYNGLRVSELVGIDVEHITQDRGLQVFLIHRKGGNTQTLPMSHRTAYAVNLLIGDRQSGPLFVSKRTADRRISRGDVQRMIKRYAAWAGITKRISPHSFRHSFITLSKNAGVPDREIQRSAGHADSRMTDYYDHGSENMMLDPTFKLSAHVEGMI